MSSLPPDGGTTPARSSVIPHNRWEEVKTEVTQLYIVQQLTLKKVMAQMEQIGFRATYSTPSNAALHRECISL